METGNQLLERAVRYSAAGTVLAFSASVALAVLSTPPGYRLFFQYLSDLGTAGPGAAYFNYGCILTAAFILVFFTSLGALERRTWLAKPKIFSGWHWLATLGMLAGMGAALGLFGVGLFPENTAGHYHAIASAVYFVGAAIAVFLFTVNKKLQETSTPGTMGVGGLFIALGLLFEFTHDALTENLAVLAFGAWLLLMARAVERKK